MNIVYYLIGCAGMWLALNVDMNLGAVSAVVAMLIEQFVRKPA